MKKSAILAIVLAMPAMAGTPTIEPAPIAPAPSVSGVAIELGNTVRFAHRKLYKGLPCEAPDTWGFDLTGVYSLDPSQAVTFSIGYDFGQKSCPIHADKDEVQLLTIMPGYRYTMPVMEGLTAYAGAKTGLVWNHVTSKDNAGKAEGKECGWGVALELGASYAITENLSIFAGYEFFVNTTHVKLPQLGTKTHMQTSHGIRSGFSWKF